MGSQSLNAFSDILPKQIEILDLNYLEAEFSFVQAISHANLRDIKELVQSGQIQVTLGHLDKVRAIIKGEFYFTKAIEDLDIDGIKSRAQHWGFTITGNHFSKLNEIRKAIFAKNDMITMREFRAIKEYLIEERQNQN